jgi:hypothetical protein
VTAGEPLQAQVIWRQQEFGPLPCLPLGGGLLWLRFAVLSFRIAGTRSDHSVAVSFSFF